MPSQHPLSILLWYKFIKYIDTHFINNLLQFLLNRTENANENRNQAVFLLTDMLIPDKEMIEIRNEYEKIYNDTNIQVELFFYFIGQDIADVQEVQWEKCLQKGGLECFLRKPFVWVSAVLNNYFVFHRFPYSCSNYGRGTRRCFEIFIDPGSYTKREHRILSHFLDPRVFGCESKI